LYGALPAVISTSLIISCPIYHYYSIAILADPILLFFYTLFILFCALYWKSQKMIYVVLAFLVSSLAFLTKINGIVLVFLLMTIFLIKNRFSILKQDYKYLITGFIGFLLISIFLNPVFLNTGIKALERMIEVRLSGFRVYQEMFKDVALLSISERFVTAVRMIFFTFSPFYKFIKVPVELIMFVVGTYYIVKRRDVLLILIFGFLVVIPISILPHNTPRYYYWIFPFTHIIAGLSINIFKEMLSRKYVEFRKIQEKVLNLFRFIGELFSKAQRNISAR
jgi:4-amino-4-deoxy-L-arabinose transferase-like glycosyltransferase